MTGMRGQHVPEQGGNMLRNLHLEALKERETIEALAKKYDIHPNQINTWKREFISKSETVFEKSTDPGRESKDKLIETLYSRIGELSVANDFF